MQEGDLESFEILKLSFGTLDGGESWELLLDDGYFFSLPSFVPSEQTDDPRTQFPPEIVAGIKKALGGGSEARRFFREETP